MRFSILLSEDASPGEELKDVSLEPVGYPSWKIEVPLDITVEGEAQKAPRLY